MPNIKQRGPISPAAVSYRDATLYSERFGDIYFSVDGGEDEARHVFLSGNGLPARWRDRDRFTIVETGFGCGLNFLLTWSAFRDHAPSGARLHFVSVEKHPFRLADLERIHGAWPQFVKLSRELAGAYPPLIEGFHRLHLDSGRVTLTLLFGDALEMLSELEARCDAFYLDGFAPSKNPDMWSRALCVELGRLAGPGATAATYSVAAAVRDVLAQAGFVVEKRSGFGRKREMLAAAFPGPSRHAPQAQRRAAVIGAGIAGTQCALALARCGFEVELFESTARVAACTSANPAGLVRPFLTLEEGARSRFTWDAFFYAQRNHAALVQRHAQPLWDPTGVLQLARDVTHLEKMHRSLAQIAIPAGLARPVDATTGAALCGAPVAGSGVWFEGAGWVRGRAACEAALQTAGDRVTPRFSTEVTGLQQQDGNVALIDASGTAIAHAPILVLANGHNAAMMLRGDLIELRPVRGQVTLVPATESRLRAPVCQEGYVTPAIDGVHVIGATFDEGEQDEVIRPADHADNLARARCMLPRSFAGIDPDSVGGWVGLRCVSRDRRPVLGPLMPGVYGCLALGSRGFTWAPLAAELIASQIAGEPLPVERSIAAAMSVQRFASGAGVVGEHSTRC